MRKLALLLLLFLPAVAFAYVSGVDDVEPNIPQDVQDKIDNAVTTYYKAPSVEKVNTVLDLMNNTDLLRKKTSWAPLVGFFTMVFGANKEHVMSWMSRNDYNTYAEDVIVAALLHANLRESAIIFAEAHQWKPEQIERVRDYVDPVDFKHFTVVLPGHIDTLWGAFFGSGDEIYIDQIIDVLFMEHLPLSETVEMPEAKALQENKRLAEKTLTYYAASDPVVRKAIEKRRNKETELVRKLILKQLLPESKKK